MVFYFSGTGNSRYVAKVIAEKSNDETISIGQRIKEGNYCDITSDKPLVFVGPVYAGRFPKIMDNYIRKVNFNSSSKVYFIATCAATAWQTDHYVKKLCDEKNFTLLGFNSIIMPQGYIAGGGTQPMEINKEILEKAKPKILDIANTISQGKPLKNEKSGKAIMSKVINPIMYATMISAKSFEVTKNKCNACGKCANNCPLNNIKLVTALPVWGKECTHCMACISGCPNEAIEYGKKTVGKTRYYLE